MSCLPSTRMFSLIATKATPALANASRMATNWPSDRPNRESSLTPRRSPRCWSLISSSNRFYAANRELGRALKTEFVLQYMSEPQLRAKVRGGLLKVEQHHALARAVYYGHRGRISAREVYDQMNACSCLTLILACIIYWQARKISRIAAASDFPFESELNPLRRDQNRPCQAQDAQCLTYKLHETGRYPRDAGCLLLQTPGEIAQKAFGLPRAATVSASGIRTIS